MRWSAVAVATVFVGSTAAARAAETYVSPSGNDSGTETKIDPYKTLAHAVPLLKPGDTLYVRAGTYAESLEDVIPGGTSWSAAVTVAAYPGEKPVLQPASGASRVLHFQGASTKYIELRGLVLDAKNVAIDGIKITFGGGSTGATHVRIADCEVMNAPGQGILLTDGADDNEFLRLSVHDNGMTDFDHGFYISTARNLVEGCEIFRNAGWGVHLYDGSATQGANDDVVRKNLIHDNARIGKRGAGVIASSGKNALVYDNVIWGNAVGIQVDYGAIDPRIFNNTVVGNRDNGIFVGAGSTGAKVQNDIVLGPTATFDDMGVGTIKDHDLIDVDPLFVDAAKHDYHLHAGSAAIDKGTTLGDVPDDFDGKPRPIGAGYDIGAFEYGDVPSDGGVDAISDTPSEGGPSEGGEQG